MHIWLANGVSKGQIPKHAIPGERLVETGDDVCVASDRDSNR